MSPASRHPLKPLSNLEQRVMNYICSAGPSTAEGVREGLATKWPMKDSTVRTILRRLEKKGYLRHKVEGRTFVYTSFDSPRNLGARAVGQIIETFCGGSVEQLLVGLVDNVIVDGGELASIARRIARQKSEGRR